METTGNTYVSSEDIDNNGVPDPGTNVMSVGAIDNCHTHEPPVNPATHTHQAHLIIQNVEDLVGWNARFNFTGDKLRVNTVNFGPVEDTHTAQQIGFANLPWDPSTFVHRTVTFAGNAGPAAPPDGTLTPQTHLAGAAYDGARTFGVSPDTPQKPVHDETSQSYNAPNGGVLATIGLQVVGDESGNQLFMDLDDGSPNSPGTGVSIFTGTGTLDINLGPNQLGDGYIGEGATCAPPTPTASPSPTVSPTPTASPTPAPVPDSDGDGWTNSAEAVIGTDPADTCADNPADNAWPADINNDTFSDITDIIFLTGNFGAAVPPAPARYDIAPDPPDGFVDITDIVRMTGLFGHSCTP